MYRKNSSIWYADFYHKGLRYVKSLKTTSKSLAKELERNFMVEVQSGAYEKSKSEEIENIKFHDVIDLYLTKESLDKKSHRRDKLSCAHLKRYFSHKVYLNKITREHVEEYKEHRKAELIKKKGQSATPVSLTSINRELACLKRLYNWYCFRKTINICNPVKGIRFYKEISRDRVLTEAEEKRFYTVGKPKQSLADIVYFALNTGARKSEILNLLRSDVFLGDLGGYVLFRQTKNGDNRQVPLPRNIADFLKRVMEKTPLGTNVFSHKNGKPIKSIDGAFREALKRAGIVGLRIHDLRHTYCTRLAHEGVNPFTIMRIVGHKDTATAKRYTNPTDEHLLAAMTKISTANLSSPQDSPKKAETPR